VKAALANTKWDYAVLQEQSTLPIKNPARFAANVRELDEMIRAHGARTALYQTWARQNAPQTQQALSAAYADLAHELGALLIPVGDAWQNALRENPAAPLFDADGSHPSLAGSQLAARVFAEALWKRN
jgi:lysophospholipase L1-like esterase